MSTSSWKAHTLKGRIVPEGNTWKTLQRHKLKAYKRQANTNKEASRNTLPETVRLRRKTRTSLDVKKEKCVIISITVNSLLHWEPQIMSRKASLAHSRSTKQNVTSLKQQLRLQTSWSDQKRRLSSAVLKNKKLKGKLEFITLSLLPGWDNVFGRFLPGIWVGVTNRLNWHHIKP